MAWCLIMPRANFTFTIRFLLCTSMDKSSFQNNFIHCAFNSKRFDIISFIICIRMRKGCVGHQHNRLVCLWTMPSHCNNVCIHLIHKDLQNTSKKFLWEFHNFIQHRQEWKCILQFRVQIYFKMYSLWFCIPHWCWNLFTTDKSLLLLSNEDIRLHRNITYFPNFTIIHSIVSDLEHICYVNGII